MAALRGSSLCYNHSPKTSRLRAVSRRNGGKRTRIGKATAPTDIESISALQQHLGGLLADTLRLSNSVKRTMTAVRVIESARRMIEDGETRILLEQLKDELQRQRRQQQ
jgi:hypothetical protein